MLQLAFYKWYDRTAAAAMHGRQRVAVIACRHMEAMVKRHAQARRAATARPCMLTAPPPNGAA